MSDARIFSPGDPVAFVRRGGYPVTGVIVSFAIDGWALLRGVLAAAANIIVTQDIGLYQAGDLVTIPVADLEPARICLHRIGGQP